MIRQWITYSRFLKTSNSGHLGCLPATIHYAWRQDRDSRHSMLLWQAEHTPICGMAWELTSCSWGGRHATTFSQYLRGGGGWGTLHCDWELGGWGGRAVFCLVVLFPLSLFWRSSTGFYYPGLPFCDSITLLRTWHGVSLLPLFSPVEHASELIPVPFISTFHTCHSGWLAGWLAWHGWFVATHMLPGGRDQESSPGAL